MNLKDFTNQLQKNTILIKKSFLGLNPGDIIWFNYDGQGRAGLVVSSRRTNSGYFLSTRNNVLLNVFLIDSLSESMTQLMVNNLYKNENVCDYHSKNIVGAFLGKDNFRTFNVSKVKNLTSVIINE